MMEVAGNTQAPVYGIAAQFRNVRELYHAAEKIRDAGYRKWDVFSPFPIHGMDDAMGLGKSWLSALVLAGGTSGFLIAFFLAYYSSVIDYPLIVDGKPVNFFTVPAFFPIMFELTILLSAFSAVGGMLLLNGLPRLNHPMFNWERFKKVTEDGFFVVIEAVDPQYNEESVEDFLESLGATNLTVVHED